MRRSSRGAQRPRGAPLAHPHCLVRGRVCIIRLIYSSYNVYYRPVRRQATKTEARRVLGVGMASSTRAGRARI